MMLKVHARQHPRPTWTLGKLQPMLLSASPPIATTKFEQSTRRRALFKYTGNKIDAGKTRATETLKRPSFKESPPQCPVKVCPSARRIFGSMGKCVTRPSRANLQGVPAKQLDSSSLLAASKRLMFAFLKRQQIYNLIADWSLKRGGSCSWL